MRRILSHIIFTAIAILALSHWSEYIHVDTYIHAGVAAVAIGLVNGVVRPVISFLTLPLTIITLGLFRLLVNGALLYVVAHYIEGFKIDDLYTAIWASLAISLICYILDFIIRDR